MSACRARKANGVFVFLASQAPRGFPRRFYIFEKVITSSEIQMIAGRSLEKKRQRTRNKKSKRAWCVFFLCTRCLVFLEKVNVSRQSSIFSKFRDSLRTEGTAFRANKNMQACKKSSDLPTFVGDSLFSEISSSLGVPRRARQKQSPRRAFLAWRLTVHTEQKTGKKTYAKQTSHRAISTHSYLCASPGRQTRVDF